MAVPGTYVITYIVEDSGGVPSPNYGRTVYVRQSDPWITHQGDNPQTVVKNAAFTVHYTKATDYQDGIITGNIVTTGDTVNTAVLGSYDIISTITDSDGNTDTGTRVVNVVTGDSPVITLLGANPQAVVLNGTYTDPGATSNDTEDGDITGGIVVGGDTVDVNTAGAYNVTYSSTDSSDNVTVETRVVNVA